MPILFDPTPIHRRGHPALRPTKINPTELSRDMIEEIADQREAHALARYRQGAEIADAAKSLRQARARLLQAVLDGKRLGLGISELSRLSGVTRPTIYRWVRANHAPHDPVKEAQS